MQREMKSLLIIGAGQYGCLVKELAEDCGYEKVAFLDDNSSVAVGKVSDAVKFREEYTEFIVAIGNAVVREKVTYELEALFRLVSLVHPTAYVSRSAVLGAGCIIEPGAVVQTDAEIGKSCIINAGAVVNHNSIVEAYSQVDCNATVTAGTVVPRGTKVVSGSVWMG